MVSPNETLNSRRGRVDGVLGSSFISNFPVLVWFTGQCVTCMMIYGGSGELRGIPFVYGSIADDPTCSQSIARGELRCGLGLSFSSRVTPCCVMCVLCVPSPCCRVFLHDLDLDSDFLTLWSRHCCFHHRYPLSLHRGLCSWSLDYPVWRIV